MYKPAIREIYSVDFRLAALLRLLEMPTTKAGMTNKLSIVENIRPPITLRASGLHVSDPAPSSKANGIIEHMVVRAVRRMGRILLREASIRFSK